MLYVLALDSKKPQSEISSFGRTMAQIVHMIASAESDSAHLAPLCSTQNNRAMQLELRQMVARENRASIFHQEAGG
jgi:hypothetical protein